MADERVSNAEQYEGGARYHHSVMAGLVPAIHALTRGSKNVDARDKPGHDEDLLCFATPYLRCQLTRFQVWPPQNRPPKAQPCTCIAFGPLMAIVES
jgi:hypothetical protein